jgi:hypothetical protein
MKKYFYIIFLFHYSNTFGQITTPIIKANFGVDGDLRANYFNNATLTPNGDDDWFNYDNSTTGVQIIDTTGAAAINAQYVANTNSRYTSFSRGMNFPSFTTINNKLLLDAIFIRDYHGTDSTAFGTASKNGDSPANWTSPNSQPVPNKNDILDVMTHVRRDGPSNSDSLWMFGGISIESTNGDRYFDFEMYQTDFYFDPTTRLFYGYGPDAGHTSWKFDASGNVTTAGDIILSADYGSSTLSSLEARIWIDKASLLITPAGFNWSGSFDGASSGSQYGYAGIQPKTAGNFYTGMENDSSTWAGSFSLIRSDNSLVTDYTPGQFMEFSVNLTKLGLDPVSLLTNGGCSMPFKKIMVKSRASTSFTASLKDFVAPIDFFQSSRAQVATNVSSSCGILQPSTVNVTNPVSGSEYTWSTTDGHIIGANTGDSITIDSAGTYVVTQRLQAGCTPYATDTINILPDNKTCIILQPGIKDFSGKISNKNVLLNWTVSGNNQINYFEIESSADGLHFTSAGKMKAYESGLSDATYNFAGNLPLMKNEGLYYRIKMISLDNHISYSEIVRLAINSDENQEIRIIPNPVKDVLHLMIYSSTENNAQLSFYNSEGLLMNKLQTHVSKGVSTFNYNDLQNWTNGVYILKVTIDQHIYIHKIILRK